MIISPNVSVASERLVKNNEVPPLPPGWDVQRFRFLFRERKERNGRQAVGEMLSVSEYRGVVPKEYEHEEQRRTGEELEDYRVVRPGQLAVNTMWLNHVGLGVSDHLGHVSPAYAVYDISDRLDRRFAHHLLRSQFYLKIYLRYLYGIRPNSFQVKADDWNSIPIIVPPLKFQRAIADFLDHETARIDQLIDKKQRFLEIADERWRSALNHSVFPTSPDWERLPADWRKVRLKYLTDPKRPIMYGIVLPGPNTEEGPMIVKGGDVKPGRLHPDHLCRTTHEIERKYVRSRLMAGDLVISIRGGIGDIEIVPPEVDGANLTQDAARIAPRSGVNAEWLRFALLSPAVFHPLEARSLGAAVRGINIFDLKRISVPEPPSTVQLLIARELKQQEGRLSDLREKISLHSERLFEFRSALITAAVTGQIDVSVWGKRGEIDRRLDRIEEEMSIAVVRA